MAYCYDCGALCTTGPGSIVPVCPEHGPRWKLRRNAPCAGLLITRDGMVLLARRAIEPFRGRWELPGGFQDLGEHPAETARREAWEELGLDVHLTRFLGFYLDPSDDGFVQVAVYEAWTADDPSGGDGEICEWRWFSVDDLPPAEEMAWSHRRRLDDWVAGGDAVGVEARAQAGV